MVDTIGFKERVAIITGAGGGLGRAYAIAFASRGAKVVVNDLGGARDGTGVGSAMADGVVEEIKAAGGTAVANYDGVHTVEGGERIVQSAIDAFGRLDILVANAGILRDRTLLKMTEDEWDAVIAVHLKQVYNVARPAVIQMRDNNYGRVVLTTSTSGHYGNFGQANYGSAKTGQLGAMNCMAREFMRYGITVNAISPAALTRMTEDLGIEDLGKMKPEQVVPAVLYLASERHTETGIIIQARAGYFNRVVFARNAGVYLGEREISVEDVAAAWEHITDLETIFPHTFDDWGGAVPGKAVRDLSS